MKITLNRVWVQSLILTFPFFIFGQSLKNSGKDLIIPLTSGFLETAAEFKVKKKPSSNTIHKKSWKKPWNFFGPYKIENWNKEPSEIKSKSNFFSTKFEQSEYKEWAYDVVAEGMDVLGVEVVYNFSSNETSSIQPFTEAAIAFGNDELIFNKLNIVIFMRFNGSEEDPWLFLVSFSESSQEDGRLEGFLVKGDRKLDVLPIESESVANFGLLPASSRGYVFQEAGRQIAAVQLQNANFWKPDARYVWLDPSLDKEFQMNLAASMSVLLLLKEDINFVLATGLMQR